MNETDYSIDEVKLMAKVKRYKRRWKEQRHYSEYLKCKLAKKAMQVQKLKEQVKTLQAIKSGWEVLDDLELENSRLQEHANNLSVEIADLHNRRMVEVRARNQAEQMMERLIGAVEFGNTFWMKCKADAEYAQKWYAKMDAIIAEWKERKND